MKQFIQKNKLIIVLLFVGVILQWSYYYNYFKTDSLISPIFTYFNLISLLLIFLSFFLVTVKNKKYIISNLFLLFFLVLVLELFCFVLLDSPDKYKKDFGLPFLPEEHIANNIGTIPNSDSAYHSISIIKRPNTCIVEPIILKNWKNGYPYFYSNKVKPSKCFKCSLAFGCGFTDHQTFPYCFQNQYNKYAENNILVKMGIYSNGSYQDTVYNVKITIDHYWRRTTPGFDSKRNKYALFFGCSIAFGQGLEDDQTFPYYFQQLTNEYNSYNYAYQGYGANHMLARLQYHNLSKQIKEKDGVGFYLFFLDHVNRTIGTMNTYTGWLSNAPYYYFSKGKLYRDKLFKNGRHLLSTFYEIVYQTSIVNYFKIDFPLKLQPKHYDLTAEIIQASKNIYKHQFGNDNFYVVIYPSFDFLPQEDCDYFKSILDKKDIKYFDLHNFINYGQEHTLGGDPHPNANTNKMLVEELIKRLNNK